MRIPKRLIIVGAVLIVLGVTLWQIARTSFGGDFGIMGFFLMIALVLFGGLAILAGLIVMAIRSGRSST